MFEHSVQSDHREMERLSALIGFDLLDTPRESEFDTAVAVACRLFNCPIATITLVDDHRQWFKAKKGLENDGCPRENSICAVAMFEPVALVINDLRLDLRFRDNPVVTQPPGTRFYAGVPLRPSSAALPGIGTLCIMDTEPRSFSAADLDLLNNLAEMVCSIIRSRKAAADTLRLSQLARKSNDRVVLQNAQLRQAERMAGIGSWHFEFETQQLTWSDQVFVIHDLPIGQLPVFDVALDFYPPNRRQEIREGLYEAQSRGRAFDIESDFITATGRIRRVRSMGEPQIVDGHIIGLTGVFQDVTERHEREKLLRESALTDALTGLRNRRAFETELEYAFVTARRDSAPLALLLLDLDGFKAVNDTLGHEAGDDVLRGIARRFRSAPFDRTFSARLGGDEFVLLLTRPRDCADMAGFVRTALTEVRYDIEHNGGRMSVSASIGATEIASDVRDASDLLRRADVSLYEAKRTERGTGRIFGSTALLRRHSQSPTLQMIS